MPRSGHLDGTSAPRQERLVLGSVAPTDETGKRPSAGSLVESLKALMTAHRDLKTLVTAHHDLASAAIRHQTAAEELVADPDHPRHFQRTGDAIVHLGRAWQLARHLGQNAERFEKLQAEHCDNLAKHVKTQSKTSFEQSRERAQELLSHALKRTTPGSSAYNSIQASARLVQALPTPR